MKLAGYRFAGALVVAMLFPTAGQAQARGGQMGAESRASIGISVSVMPRFTVSPAAAQTLDSTTRLNVATNLGSVRFHVVALRSSSDLSRSDLLEGPPGAGPYPQSPEGGPDGQPTLLLVIPD